MPFYRSGALGVIHMKGKKLPAPCGERLLFDGETVVCVIDATIDLVKIFGGD